MLCLKLLLILTMIFHGYSTARIDKDDDDIFTLNVTMKDYQSNKEDEIVFVQYKLPDEELVIVGYRPLVSMVTAHHMNMVACETPASEKPYWTSGVIGCGQGARMLLYGWDRDALPFRLLDDIGIVVGKNTPYKYLVVNIHFVPIVKHDYSGNQLLMSRKRRKHLAGVMSGGAEVFSLAPKTFNIKTPFSCQYQGPKITLFAVGVHAHQWARVNSLYRVRNHTIIQIVKVDPQQIHQSYRLSSSIEILSGDYIVGQCVFDNTENRVIQVGLSHNDEMCNVMAGYWYERNDHQISDGRVPFESCWGDLFPHVSSLIPHDSEIPPPKASMIVDNVSKHAMTISVIVLLIVVGLLLLITGWNRYNRPWMFVGWCQKGTSFDQLQQQSDDEMEFLER